MLECLDDLEAALQWLELPTTRRQPPGHMIAKARANIAELLARAELSTPEAVLRHQADCILNELRAARELAEQMGHNPAVVTPPYLDHLQRLYAPPADTSS